MSVAMRMVNTVIAVHRAKGKAPPEFLRNGAHRDVKKSTGLTCHDAESCI
jgi:hypothetical protein